MEGESKAEGVYEGNLSYEEEGFNSYHPNEEESKSFWNDGGTSQDYSIGSSNKNSSILVVSSSSINEKEKDKKDKSNKNNNKNSNIFSEKTKNISTEVIEKSNNNDINNSIQNNNDNNDNYINNSTNTNQSMSLFHLLKNITTSNKTVIDVNLILLGEENRTTAILENFPPDYKGENITSYIDNILKISTLKKNRLYDLIYKPENLNFWIINFISPQMLLNFYRLFQSFQFSDKYEKIVNLSFCPIQGKDKFINIKKNEEYGPFFFDDSENVEKYFLYYYLKDNKIYSIMKDG